MACKVRLRLRQGARRAARRLAARSRPARRLVAGLAPESHAQLGQAGPYECGPRPLRLDAAPRCALFPAVRRDDASRCDGPRRGLLARRLLCRAWPTRCAVGRSARP
eukprot:1632160-Alexandrium_andersonii.AAC.1